MKGMSLASLANLAEIIGAMAIVISLIYVGKQLNANTAAVQAASLQSITNSSANSMLAIAANGEMAEIRIKGDRDPALLSEVERLRYVLYQRQMWFHFQNVWTQWRLGVIHDDVWLGYQHVICDDMVNTPKKLKWWRDNHSYSLSSDFTQLVGSCQQHGD